ncbi:uncharacterized protein H6S33_008193 [Morchella sextelata]|uniref:uncharacterized protein n=1 Tax=Morchella sextelata TaxID=1174677 RepID=UPI001D05AD03|nr:uncharacterized protein H6S33_008193 [Morchella sextelata]KAH0603189.1 hypothetical protein H6S33_008193 [Morchella sextelata]
MEAPLKPHLHACHTPTTTEYIKTPEWVNYGRFDENRKCTTNLLRRPFTPPQEQKEYPHKHQHRKPTQRDPDNSARPQTTPGILPLDIEWTIYTAVQFFIQAGPDGGARGTCGSAKYLSCNTLANSRFRDGKYSMSFEPQSQPSGENKSMVLASARPIRQKAYSQHPPHSIAPLACIHLNHI